MYQSKARPKSCARCQKAFLHQEYAWTLVIITIIKCYMHLKTKASRSVGTLINFDPWYMHCGVCMKLYYIRLVVSNRVNCIPGPRTCSEVLLRSPNSQIVHLGPLSTLSVSQGVPNPPRVHPKPTWHTCTKERRLCLDVKSEVKKQCSIFRLYVINIAVSWAN